MKTKAQTVQQQARARQRVEMFLQVRSGLLTAKEAARRLGISRKTYYKWEKRAMVSIIEAMSEQCGGRPKRKADPEKQSLQRQNQQLQQRVRVLEQTAEIRRMLACAAKKKP